MMQIYWKSLRCGGFQMCARLESHVELSHSVSCSLVRHVEMFIFGARIVPACGLFGWFYYIFFPTLCRRSFPYLLCFSLFISCQLADFAAEKKTQQHLNFLFDFYALPATPRRRLGRAGRAERKWDSGRERKEIAKRVGNSFNESAPRYQCFLHAKLYNFCSPLAAFSHDFHPKFESPTRDRLRGIVHMIDGWRKKRANTTQNKFALKRNCFLISIFADSSFGPKTLELYCLTRRALLWTWENIILTLGKS